MFIGFVAWAPAWVGRETITAVPDKRGAGREKPAAKRQLNPASGVEKRTGVTYLSEAHRLRRRERRAAEPVPTRSGHVATATCDLACRTSARREAGEIWVAPISPGFLFQRKQQCRLRRGDPCRGAPCGRSLACATAHAG